MRRSLFLASALAVLALVSGAAASGPSLPAVEGGAGLAATTGGLRYVTQLVGPSTRILERSHGRIVRTKTVPGNWGIQLATIGGVLAGLSPNGRVLVLTDDVRPTGNLRAWSRFAVLDTRTLALRKTITLRGDFSVDALSPQGDTLYLIHHVSRADATKYQVQAYDLAGSRLLPGVIADRRQAGWIMRGMPVARVTTATGRWVYTLYSQSDNYPFVHILDTMGRVAICVGIPADWTQQWISSARLELIAGKLAVETNGGQRRFLLDTKTFRVVRF